jgi:hypothetical protein
MAKRFRDKHRFEDGYRVALAACEQQWSRERTWAEIESVLAENGDLVADNSMQQQRREMRRWADPRLCGWLPTIRERAESEMAAQFAGSGKRLNHVFDTICRDALKHPLGVSAALGNTTP